MRVLGIDYGEARTGLSVSDATGLLAGSPSVIQEGNPDRLREKLIAFIRKEKIEEIVLGCPKNMDGSEGERARKSRALGDALKQATGLPVVMWDERRTTVQAHAILRENGRKTKKHKKNVDAVAASLILQGYLDYKKMHP